MKTETTTIICDSCSADISPKITSYPANYILRVSCINVDQHTEYQAIYSIAMQPPIDNDLYFCNLRCMTQYQEKKQ